MSDNLIVASLRSAPQSRRIMSLNISSAAAQEQIYSNLWVNPDGIEQKIAAQHPGSAGQQVQAINATAGPRVKF